MEYSYLKYLISWLAFITLAIPILSPIFIIVYIFRTFVEITAKIFRTDLVKRLNSSEYILSIDKLYKKPFSNNILLIYTKQRSTLEQVQNGFTQSVLEKRTSANTLEFPNLFLYPKEFCSYFFWKKVQSFHIRHYTKEVVVNNECDIDAFLSAWIIQPYDNGKSPWEITLIRILENDSTAIALKMHNVITSGYGFSQIFDAMLQKQQKVVPMHSGHNALHYMKLILVFPYILFKIYMQEITNHENFSTPYNLEIVSSRVEIQSNRLKNLANKDFDSAITASLTGALRRLYAEEKCSKSNNNYPNLKIGKFSSTTDPIQTLLEVENETEENKNYISEISSKQVPILSILPKRILRAIFGVPSASVIRHTSISFNVDEENTFLWGKPISDIYFIGGQSRPNWGVTLSSTCTSNNTGCCIIASKDVIPNQDIADRTMKYFKEEINQISMHYS